ncbi:hypothetical protein L195_g030938, partial [Trifolium pratense]
MWRGRIGSTFVPLLQHFRFPLVSQFLDWLFIAQTLSDHFVQFTISAR